MAIPPFPVVSQILRLKKQNIIADQQKFLVSVEIQNNFKNSNKVSVEDEYMDSHNLLILKLEKLKWSGHPLMCRELRLAKKLEELVDLFKDRQSKSVAEFLTIKLEVITFSRFD